MAALVLIGLLVRRSRLLFVLAPVFGLLAAGDYVTVEQNQFHYKPDIGWPSRFGVANTLAWMALSLLLAGAVVEVARSRPWRRAALTEEPSAAPLPPSPIEPPDHPLPELTVHVATHRERVLAAAHPDEGPGETAIVLPAADDDAAAAEPAPDTGAQSAAAPGDEKPSAGEEIEDAPRGDPA